MGLALKLGGLFDRGLGYAWAILCPIWGQPEPNYGHQVLHFEMRLWVSQQKVVARAHAGLLFWLFWLMSLHGRLYKIHRKEWVRSILWRSMVYVARNRSDMLFSCRLRGLSLM